MLSRPLARPMWYAVGLLSLANVFNYMDRMALAVLAPQIKADLHFSDAQLGLLVGFAFFIFYAVCGIPMARWADRGIRVDIIAMTLSIWSVMAALSGAAQNFWQLLAARVGLGAGEAGCVPASVSLIADYVPFQRRPGAYAVNGLGLTVGMMAGLVLAGWLGERIGWRWTFVVLGLPGLALALLVKLTLREPLRGANDGLGGDTQSISLRETMTVLWQCKSYRLILVFFITNGFGYAGLMQWWPSFYGRVFAISLSSVGSGLGLAIGAGAGLGTVIGGVLANKAARRNVRLPLQIGAWAMGLALPVTLASLFVSSVSVSMSLAFMSLVLWSVPSGPIGAALCSVARPSMRATAGALTTFCISILGFGLGPLLVGLLSDGLTPLFGADSLRYALLLPAAALVGPTVMLYAVSKTLPDDLKAVGVQI